MNRFYILSIISGISLSGVTSFKNQVFADSYVTIDSSGVDGKDGDPGRSGRNQREASDRVEHGENASRSTRGKDARSINIRLRVIEDTPNSVLRVEGSEVKDYSMPVQRISLTAKGGSGGNGARGGNGGDGARGKNGEDFSRNNWTPSSGANGGDGGDAGAGSDGSDGGDGGNIDIRIEEKIAYLLLGLSTENQGGLGGRAGRHGDPGSPGEGGSAGSTSYYDSEKGETVRSPVSTKAGERGRRGRDATARLESGSSGRRGDVRIAIDKQNGETILVSEAARTGVSGFNWTESDPNGILEAGEILTVKSLSLWAEGPAALAGVPLNAVFSKSEGMELQPLEAQKVKFSFPEGFVPGSKGIQPQRVSIDLPIENGITYQVGDGEVKLGVFLMYPHYSAYTFLLYGQRMGLIEVSKTPPRNIEIKPGRSGSVEFQLLNLSTKALGIESDSKREIVLRMSQVTDHQGMQLKFGPAVKFTQVDVKTWDILVSSLLPKKESPEGVKLPMTFSVDAKTGFFESAEFSWKIMVDKFDDLESMVNVKEGTISIQSVFGPQALKLDTKLNEYKIYATFADGRKRKLSQLWINRDEGYPFASIQYEQSFFGHNSPKESVAMSALAPYLSKISGGKKFTQVEALALFKDVIMPATKSQRDEWRITKVEVE